MEFVEPTTGRTNHSFSIERERLVPSINRNPTLGRQMGLLLLNLKTGTSRWSEDPSKKLIDAHGWSKIAAMAGFTDRELEVSQLIFQGKTRNDVAERLGITGRTVRQYMENLYKKLNVSTRVGFVLRLIQIRDHICK